MTFVLGNSILMAYDQRPADPQRGRGGDERPDQGGEY
jgi:hypothetical protein